MNIKEMMQSVPDSYDDFVNSVVRWTDKEERIKNEILDHMKKNPNSSASDVLGVLWDCLGLSEPLEIVDDEMIDGKITA